MGDRGVDMQQSTTGKIRTRVTAVRTEPIWYALYPVSYRGAPFINNLNKSRHEAQEVERTGW